MIRPYPFVVAIIQARMGSHRFPGKMMADLGGRPLINWSIERLKMCKRVHEIVVASPNKELVEAAYDAGVLGFHDTGDENNVLGRYLRCSNWCSADVVVRITGDCPFIDPEIADNVVKGFLENHVDISTNVLHRTFPRGFDSEVLHINVLKRIFHLTQDRGYREHVTLFAYEHPELFVFHSILDSEDNSRFNVSVDTPADLDKLNILVASLKKDISCTWREITEALKNGELDRRGHPA